MTDAELAETLDWFDDRFLHDDFAAANLRLEGVYVPLLDEDDVVALLTATLPAKSKLPARKGFFDRAKKQLERATSSSLDVNETLRGLE